MIQKYLDTMKKMEQRGKANPNNFVPVVRTVKVYSTLFSKALIRQFYHLTFHMKRYAMHYDSFRLQLKDILSEMEADVREIDWMAEKLDTGSIAPADEVSLVIISKEAEWLMDNLLSLDKQCCRYQQCSGQKVSAEAVSPSEDARSWVDDLNTSFQWAYGRIRRIRKCCEHFKEKMAKDFGYSHSPKKSLEAQAVEDSQENCSHASHGVAGESPFKTVGVYCQRFLAGIGIAGVSLPAVSGGGN